MFNVNTVNELFAARVAESENEVAYRYPVTGADGADEWREMTWAEAARRVRRIASGLIGLGIEPGNRVAIMADTSIHWVMADFGILAAGAAVTTVYPSTKPDGVEYILRDSGAKVMFIGHTSQAVRLGRRAPLLKIVFDGPSDPENGVLSMAELERHGREQMADHAGAFERVAREVGGDSLATLI